VDIVCNAFSELENEVKQEFFEDVVTAIRDINDCVSELQESVNENVIDRMFRAIHTVKGNCNMVFLEAFVNATHRLEDLFSAIRSKEIDYHSVYGRFAIQIVNLIELQLRVLIETDRANGDILEKLNEIIDEVQSAKADQQVITAEKAITAIKDGHFTTSMVIQDSDNGHAFSFMDATDMEFFEYLSSQHQQNRSHFQFYEVCSVLANKLNNMLTASADEQQFHAAIIFLHLVQKVEPDGIVNEMSVQQCIMASGLLSRMAGWSEAAELCLQAMEFHNGNGAPKSLAGADILPAAQVLALSFDFAFQILAAIDQPYKQKLFAAVKNINTKKDTQYKAKLIQRFNQLIKAEYLNEKMF